ncbi:hypothetical protein ACFWWT_09085 [Streptomyces sp. NPDC058676]|uniref:hypothetical protein n=1 Tax=unclassified Streptomyces TaxID=2593676 RepID=UPI003669FB5B
MTSAVEVPVEAVELLVRDAELLVVDEGREIPGGWVAVMGGRVTGAGSAGTEPEVRTTVSAAGRFHATRARPAAWAARTNWATCGPGRAPTWSCGTCTRSRWSARWSDPVEAWLRCGPARAWTRVVAGKVLVDRGEPILPVLADALRTHGGIARRMQRIQLPRRGPVRPCGASTAAR